MSLLNLAGPLEASLAPPVPVEAVELRRRLEAGEWVVDLRSKQVFAADHLTGSIAVAFDDAFSTYLGWLIPWGSRLTLLAATADDIASAQRQLVRIGLDQLGGAATGELDEVAPDIARSSYPATDFVGLAAAIGRGEAPRVVDVRRRDEWQSGHLEGSRNLPLHELLEHSHHAPDGVLWVHCASGYRAAIGASLLARARFPVVLVDDDFDRAEAAGLSIVTPS
jgi:rhodanese-related sulfurtransferase